MNSQKFLNYDTCWQFKQIPGHQAPLHKADSNYKGCNYNVTVQWKAAQSHMSHLTFLVMMLLKYVQNMVRNMIYY